MIIFISKVGDKIYNTKIVVYNEEITDIKLYSNYIHTGRSKRKQDEFKSYFEEETKAKRGESENIYTNIHRSVKRTKEKLKELLLSNKWEYFVTITFNPKIHDSLNYDVVSKVMANWLKNIKKNHCSDVKYIGVPEYHKKSRRFHFHFLMSDIGTLNLKDSGYVKCHWTKRKYIKRSKYEKTKKYYKLNDTDGVTIYNINSYNSGFTTLMPVIDSGKASSYLLKYLTKELFLGILNKKRYWRSYNLDKPTIYKVDRFIREETTSVNLKTLEDASISSTSEYKYENLDMHIHQSVRSFRLKTDDVINEELRNAMDLFEDVKLEW